MELILSNHCRSFTGSISRRYGYAIRRSGRRFFSVRSPQGPRVRDGHLRFIFACARMAQAHWLAEDIRVRGEELLAAAAEAGLTLETIRPHVQYNASEVLKMYKTYEDKIV